MWRRGRDWWRLWTESRAVYAAPRLRRRSGRRQGTRRAPAPAPERRAARPASPRRQQRHPPRRQPLLRLMRQAVRRQGTRRVPAPAPEWPPARPPPLRPLGSHPPRRRPLLRLMRRSVPLQSTRQVPASAPEWHRQDRLGGAGIGAPFDSAAGADCGAVAAGAADGAPPAGAPSARAAGADCRGGAALASIAIGLRLAAAAVSPCGAGVSPPPRRAGAAGTAAARVRFGARRKDSCARWAGPDAAPAARVLFGVRRGDAPALPSLRRRLCPLPPPRGSCRVTASRTRRVTRSSHDMRGSRCDSGPFSRQETARRLRHRIGAVLRWSIGAGHRTDNPAGEAISEALQKNGTAVRQHRRTLHHREVAGALAKIRASAQGHLRS